MAYPSCGYECIVAAINSYSVGCIDVACLCEKSSYLSAVYACIQPCDAADYNTWVNVGIEDCSLHGATFPSYAQSGISSPTSVATGAAFVSTTQVSVIVSVTVTNSVSDFFGLSTTFHTTSAGSTAGSGSIPSSATVTPVGVSKSSHSGLSTGATAGISIGGVALLLIAVLIGLLLSRRPRKQQHTPPAEATDADKGSTSGVVVEGRQYFEKDSKGLQEEHVKVEPVKIVQEEHIESQPIKFAEGNFEGRQPSEKPPSPQMSEADSTAMSYNITSVSELPDPSQMYELHSTSILPRNIPGHYSELYTQPPELGSLSPPTAQTASSNTLMSSVNAVEKGEGS